MSMDEQTLKEKLRPIMEEIVFNLVSDKPEEPVDYMIKYLEKKEGFTSNGITLKEKKELEELRKEIIKYRQFEEDQLTKNEESVSNNLDNNTTNPNDKSYSDNEEDDEVDVDYNIEAKVLNSKARLSKQRDGVSAEAYGMFNKKQQFIPKVIKKSNNQIQRIKARILQNFLFSSLDSKDLDVVIRSMEEKNFAKGENVINQYDNGNCLYVIEEGELNCYRKEVRDSTLLNNILLINRIKMLIIN